MSSDLDLARVISDRGMGGACEALLSEWWDFTDVASGQSGRDLLERLRSTDVADRIGWPQEVVLDRAAAELIAGRPVIARESQFLWQAVLTETSGGAYVEVVSDELAGAGHATLARMDLSEFLLRVLVNAAVFSARPQIKAKATRAADQLQVLPEIRWHRSILFPAVLADAGWFAIRIGARLSVATKLDPHLVADSGAGTNWQQLVSTPRSADSWPGADGTTLLQWSPIT